MSEAKHDDGAAGLAWWNAMGDADRRFWMLASMGSSPADAWNYFKRCSAVGITSSAQLGTKSAWPLPTTENAS